MTMEYYTDHNTSITITVSKEEAGGLKNKIYKNWDKIVGVSCLPKSTTAYPQLPYEAISEEKYKELMKDFPEDLSILQELIDNIEKEEYNEEPIEDACSTGACPLR
jgi:hypothetical protein